jgi:hypothetical protein
LKSSSLTQSSNISRKTQEYQEHSMAFGKDLIKILRNGLARHEVNYSKHEIKGKHDLNKLRTLY